MQTLTAERQKRVSSMKASVEILRAAARNCPALEAAGGIMRGAALLAAKLAVLGGAPRPLKAKAQVLWHRA